MTKLKKLFDKSVRDIEHVDSTGYKTWSIKQRLKRKYPQICFLQLARRYQSELVYVDDLSAEEIVEEATLLNESLGANSDTYCTDSDDNDKECKKDRHYSHL